VVCGALFLPENIVYDRKTIVPKNEVDFEKEIC
jgi:hypothetical protein